MEYRSFYESCLGKILLISNGGFLTGLYFYNFNSKFDLDRIKEVNDLEVFKITKNWLDLYFKGKNPNISVVPIKLIGSDFCLQVWEELLKIPYGETVSYGYIASIISKRKNIKKMSAQAVGQAVGKNPISIIVPCHRVIGKNGTLVGYGGGLDKKIGLLEIENKDRKFLGKI